MTTLSTQAPVSVHALFGPRGDKAAVEEGLVLAPKLDGDGLIAAITVDDDTDEVLMLAWMNAEALALTIETGEAHYWSRSRGEIWHKGATSGHTQKVREIRVDCDQDAVLLRVEAGPACHVGYRSCFYRAVERSPDGTARLVNRAEKAYDPDAVYGAV